MDLKERAISEYKKEKKLMEESNAGAADIFAEKARKELLTIVGTQHVNTVIIDKRLCYASFSIDDMLFGVSTSECCYVINMIHKCFVCGSDVNTRILSIKDIGKALVEPHNKYDCDRALEAKDRLEELKRENGDGNEDARVLSTDEKLLAALKDFILEHGHMCSSI